MYPVDSNLPFELCAAAVVAKVPGMKMFSGDSILDSRCTSGGIRAMACCVGALFSS
jgi:hypothetical protein